MKFLAKALPLILLLPVVALAQSGNSDVANLRGFEVAIGNLVRFVNGVLVPAIFALAFLVFIWGMFTTFIFGGHDEEKQSKGKQLMVYAIAGFVLMISIWGIVNLVARSIGLDDRGPYTLPQAPLPGVRTN